MCVIRTSEQQQTPMLITWSHDHGCTWEEPRQLFTFGVFPALVRLDNGVLLMAFGRPGVWVSASLDGTGRTWTEPVPVIEGELKDAVAHSCGYTGLLPVGKNEALLVYSNFRYNQQDSQACKSIEVRRITIGQ